MKNRTKAIILAMLFAGVLMNCEQPTNSPGAKVENPDTAETLPTLTIGTEPADIKKLNANTYQVTVKVPNGAAAKDITFDKGKNFIFPGKTFNFGIEFESGIYNGSILDAITEKFKINGSAIGPVNTTPQEPSVEALPTLKVGDRQAMISQGDNPNTFNVSIEIPDSADKTVFLSEETNFSFDGKTFNLDITFASGVYDDNMVDAIKSAFTAKGEVTVEIVKTTPQKPPEPAIVQPTLKIDGVEITIPIPAEGVNTINVSIIVSNGIVADFSDPNGILAGKTINLNLDTSTPAAADGLKRINYSAIASVENAFKANGAAAVSSNTDDGIIPVFTNPRLKNDPYFGNIIEILSSKASPEKPNVKIVNGIRANYNNGNPKLSIESAMQIEGTIFGKHFENIDIVEPNGKLYADDSLRLMAGYRINPGAITLEEFINVYTKCGFNFTNNDTNTFFPNPGCVCPLNDYSAIILSIIDNNHNASDSDYKQINGNNWKIYQLFERYHAKGKLANLINLETTHLIIAGENANGLYGANNQPLDTFPYKVNGEIIGFMAGNVEHFENMYEDGTHPIPATIGTLSVKNFATKSNLPTTQFTADGACFFEHAPPYVNSTGAVKVNQAVMGTSNLLAKYLDLRNLAPTNKVSFGEATEVAFSELAAAPQNGAQRNNFNYDTGYYVDNGTTKLIPIGAQHYASNQTSLIYGVLDLQGWVNGNPPRDKSAIQPHSIVKLNPTTHQNPALILAGAPAMAAVMDDRKRGLQRS